MAGLTQEDRNQIEAYRLTASPEETAHFAADLYRLRATASGNFFAGFPRYVIILIAVWFGLLETADKLPQLLLAMPRYEAALAEAKAKLLQPDMVQAQLTKAENDAEASKLQPDMVKVQLTKAENDAEASKLQPDTAKAQLTRAQYEAAAAVVQPQLAQVQLEKASNDAKTSALQPELTAAQLEKTKQEALAAQYQPQLNQLQIVKLAIDAKTAGVQLPTIEQSAAFSNVLLGVMNGLVGIKPSDTEPVSSRPAAIEPSRPVVQPPKAPVTGPALLTTDRFISLGNAADDAVARHDCAAAARIYNEGIPILNAALPKSVTSTTVDQRNEAMKILSIRVFVNNPQNCPHGPTVP